MGFDFSWFTTPGLLRNLSDFGKKMGSGLSNGLSKVKDIGSTTGNMNNLTFATPKPSADSLTFGSLSSPEIGTGGFSGSAIQQSDLNPNAFRGSVVQQSDLPDMDSYKITLKDKWNAIPQEKKTAFAQAMSESAQQQAQPQEMYIDYTPQDFSWALQPTRGSMFYGN